MVIEIEYEIYFKILEFSINVETIVISPLGAAFLCQQKLPNNLQNLIKSYPNTPMISWTQIRKPYAEGYSFTVSCQNQSSGTDIYIPDLILQ